MHIHNTAIQSFHRLRSTMQQYATHLGILKKVVLAVDLGQLEGGTGAEALLLGHVIELIKTALSLLCFLWHVQKCNKLNRNIINISLSKQLKVR